MPELPEVQTIVSDLERSIKGAVFESASAIIPQTLVPSTKAFRAIHGKRVSDLGRIGKFINLFFENGYVITIHLRMTGRLIISSVGSEPVAFERARLYFEGFELAFGDQRRFGRIWLNPLQDYEEKTGIARLGADVMAPEFTLKYFVSVLKNKRGPIKARLLDQTLMAGIGNIYADESCYYAKIRPDTPTEKLQESQLKNLRLAIIQSIAFGVKNRGTSVPGGNYLDARGEYGNHQNFLNVYKRGELPCNSCHRPLIRTRVVGRGTVYCEECQPLID